jgi:DNA-binding transcriptional ArsR family regulator
MDVEHELVKVAALVGEPARAIMLWNLLGGQAKPAGELAYYANVSAQNASAHLAKLVDGGLLAVETRGRHRYYRLANPEVAQAMESLAALTSSIDTNDTKSADESGQTLRPQTPDLKFARTCYDHLAGRAAVDLCAALLNKRFLTPTGNDYELTPQGELWFCELGIETVNLRQQRRAFARQCLDWSERRPHLAGALGGALLAHMFRQGWIARVRSSRVIRVTTKGRTDIYQLLGLTL